MFESIIGHDENKKLLENNLVHDSISHAYLFSGKKGVGKCLLAKEFAKAILKVDKLESSPDYKYISKRDDKKDIVIEQIRKDLIDDVYQVPASGDKKVYIIDDAECLNVASQNALLKTLEEPPKYVVVILISSNVSAFLTTIISRVNLISFEGLDYNMVKSYLQNNLNTTFPDSIIKYIDGSIGQAINIYNDSTIEKFKTVESLYNCIKNKDVINAMLVSSNIKFNENMLLDYLEFLLYEGLFYSCTKFVEKAKIRLKYNGNYDIVIDNMLLNIIDNIV